MLLILKTGHANLASISAAYGHHYSQSFAPRIIQKCWLKSEVRGLLNAFPRGLQAGKGVARRVELVVELLYYERECGFVSKEWARRLLL